MSLAILELHTWYAHACSLGGGGDGAGASRAGRERADAARRRRGGGRGLQSTIRGRGVTNGKTKFAPHLPPYCLILTCLLPLAQELGLSSNKIGNDGMIAFSDAISKGALPALEDAYFFGNPGSDQPVKSALDRRNK